MSGEPGGKVRNKPGPRAKWFLTRLISSIVCDGFPNNHSGGIAMSDEGNSRNVIVTDIHMPFLSMVIFMVKWALASIPAIIILMVIASLVWRILLGADSRTVVRLGAPSISESNS